MNLTIVLDEAQFTEFIHEKIDSRPRRPDHLGQRLLGYFGERLLEIAWLSITREQQESASQAFFAGVEELVYQILFHANVSCQHVSNEPVGKFVFPVKYSNHLAFSNDEHSCGQNRYRSRHTNGLACQASFSEKIPRTQNRYNGFSADCVDDSKLYATVLNVHYIFSSIALCEDDLFFSELAHLS